MKKDPRFSLLYEQLTHYHDILYTSGHEFAETTEHNTLLIKMLCIHLLNHILKVVPISAISRRAATSSRTTRCPSARRSVF